uniref:ADP-ribose glycohydrolase ARH3-like n=1 Tax=Styela clava TaxID=7725 RepID=UPI00193A3F86|nr:ADP-ribose glycohydrolase ARH3-like [Styela clava]
MAAQELTLLSKFQGVSLGALFGDCLGANFENDWKTLPYETVKSYYDTINDEVTDARRSGFSSIEEGYVRYTDDTCMTFDLGESLVRMKIYDPNDISKRFSDTYFRSPLGRNYGNHVTDCFRKRRIDEYKHDVYRAASEQFMRTGSFGNGSAMRVSPVTLFHHDNIPEMVALAADQSRLTHSNPKGINGAVLQALAIEKAMTSGKIEDTEKFCHELIAQLKEVTPAKEELVIYEEKIESVVGLLKAENGASPGEIIEKLGTDVRATESVPAAIFFFLYTLNRNQIPELSSYNGMVRCVISAAAVGHDSDTIASMAGAIAGAYYGVEFIPTEWVWACEASRKALKLANALHDINQGIEKSSGCPLM